MSFLRPDTVRNRPPAPMWRVWLLAALGAAWFVLVLQLVTFAADGPRRIDPSASTGLGTGPDWLQRHDPVAALAADLTEHLPGGPNGLTAPLPLHAPDGGQPPPPDEVQGAEFPSLEPALTRSPPRAERRPPPPGEDCCSVDPLLADRPPTPADDQP